jgi:hypothetical protein
LANSATADYIEKESKIFKRGNVCVPRLDKEGQKSSDTPSVFIGF